MAPKWRTALFASVILAMGFLVLQNEIFLESMPSGMELSAESVHSADGNESLVESASEKNENLNQSTRGQSAQNRLQRNELSPTNPPTAVTKTPSLESRKVILYDRELPTGFGDRFSTLLCVTAMAEAVGADAATFWMNNTDAKGSHRYYPPETIFKMMRFPSNLRVTTRKEFVERYQKAANPGVSKFHFDEPGLVRSTLGFDGVYTIAPKTLRLEAGFSQVSQEQYVKAYRKVAPQLTIDGAYEKYLKWLPSKYIALHARGADKFNGNVNRYKTKDVLDRLTDNLILVVISDDARLVRLILERNPRLQTLRRPDVFSLNLTSTELALLDFEVLLRSSAIIQHSPGVWSAFSSTAAMARGIPLLNTQYMGTNSKAVGLYANLLSHGEVPEELMTANYDPDYERFLKILTELR